MEQPEGFQKIDKNGEILVCKLKKSLYGLKQSGRNWNNMLHTFLCNIDFSQSHADPCVYINKSRNRRLSHPNCLGRRYHHIGSQFKIVREQTAATCEAEYISKASAAKFLKQLCNNMNIATNDVLLNAENQGTIILAKNQPFLKNLFL